ncbi:MAG: DUF2071 domain-containing protein [Planctomycetota bacterium]
MDLTMIGRLTDTALLSFRTPAASVAHLLPEGLELVTRGPWAFWNVVSCRVEHMRPRKLGPVMSPTAGIPAVGVSYHHVAYRLLVQAMTRRGEVRRGLYFLRSDADARVLGAVGNLTTDFKFHAADIHLAAPAGDVEPLLPYRLDVTSRDGKGDARLRLDETPPRLAADSCFPTLTDAREFLKYQPFAFAVAGRTGRRHLRLAEVRRDESAWHETPAHAAAAEFAFFDHLGQDELTLELATRVRPMDYTWHLGRTEPLLGQQAEPVEEPAEADGADLARSA